MNVSQALGDKNCHYKGKSALSHIPNVSLFQVREGDLILLACDGLWDILLGSDGKLDQAKVKKLLSFIKTNWDEENLSEKLVDYALQSGSTDNVSVIHARAKLKRNRLI